MRLTPGVGGITKKKSMCNLIRIPETQAHYFSSSSIIHIHSGFICYENNEILSRMIASESYHCKSWLGRRLGFATTG